MSEAIEPRIPSYPKVWALGHPQLSELFDGPVVVEEKVDGSQFGFGVIDGHLCCRSRGQQLVLDAPDNMFVAAVQTARELEDKLTPGWVYRGEYLRSPKHNTLKYNRTPERHVVLFDVMTGPETYLGPDEKSAEAQRLGLEIIPHLFSGEVTGVDQVLEFMKRESFLGGPLIEGMVFKNYARFGTDKKVLMGKFVSEAFKESHRKEWKQSNPGQADVLTLLGEEYRSPARWEKAIQHLRESGKLEGSPRDIGALIKEVQHDIETECAQEIGERLFRWAKSHVIRKATFGLPEWYKARLVESQFSGEQ